MTAVEWLMQEYEYEGSLSIKKFEYALEMEKENIINAFRNGYLCHSKKGEQYYNEKFKK